MEENKLEIIEAQVTSVVELPLSGSGVSAGFPSPADDHTVLSLDLNKELIRNPAATFFARVSGVSMKDEGINDGDLLVIDKSVEPYDGCLVVAFVDGEFTLKRIKYEKDCLWLVPANEDYRPIKITKDNDFTVWGVVRYVIKKV